MSVYDQRENSAYGPLEVEPHYSKNRHVRKWWTQKHDRILIDHIAQQQWLWYWTITDQIVLATPQNEIDKWKDSDPLCREYAWYNVLMYFAASRAQQLGLTAAIRWPKSKLCALCRQQFKEDSLPVPLAERLGINRIDFCAPCLRDTVLQGSGSDSLPRKSILRHLRDLAAVIDRVPPQNFGEGRMDLLDLKTVERLALLKVLRGKPTLKRVKRVFGSWLNALIHAGLLEDGTRPTSRGTQCVAKDGHVCLSLGEKTIDDFLHFHRIPHEKEPRYPEGGFRADFKVGRVFIEYFGLAGNPDYDTKTTEKKRLCQKHRITLIAIYPQDLVFRRKLEGKLNLFFESDRARAGGRTATPLALD